MRIWYTGSGIFARDTKATGKEVEYKVTVDFLFNEEKIGSSDGWMSGFFISYHRCIIGISETWLCGELS